MNKKLSNFDKQLIKVNYGSMREYNKYKKDERDFQEKIIQIDEKIQVSKALGNFFDSIHEEEARQKELKYKREIKESAVKQYSKYYLKWLIAYDLLNNSYHEIKNSLNRNKITINDLKEVVIYCNSIHEIFDLNDIITLVS